MNDEEERVLLTRQMLMALEEMPPHTGYCAFLTSEDPLVVFRITPDELGAYAMMVSAEDPSVMMMRVFPDRDTFVMSLGAAPVVPKGGAWSRVDTDQMDILVDYLTDAVPHAEENQMDVGYGFTILVDGRTNSVAIVNGPEAAREASREFDRIYREQS